MDSVHVGVAHDLRDGLSPLALATLANANARPADGDVGEPRTIDLALEVSGSPLTSDAGPSTLERVHVCSFTGAGAALEVGIEATAHGRHVAIDVDSLHIRVAHDLLDRPPPRRPLRVGARQANAIARFSHRVLRVLRASVRNVSSHIDSLRLVSTTYVSRSRPAASESTLRDSPGRRRRGIHFDRVPALVPRASIVPTASEVSTGDGCTRARPRPRCSRTEPVRSPMSSVSSRASVTPEIRVLARFSSGKTNATASLSSAPCAP